MTKIILTLLIASAFAHVDDKLDWSQSNNGLAIAIVASSNKPAINQIDFYLGNKGANNIEGVIQSDARCVLEINGQFYATDDFGGKSSYMPPGRMYGPILIRLSLFYKIPKLELNSVYPDKPVFLELPKGSCNIRVYYKNGISKESFLRSNALILQNTWPDRIRL
jgi:hypothetical protein